MTDTGPLFVSSGDLIADRRYKWALDQAARGDFAGAADVLAQTVALAPGFATAWFALGAIRDRLGDRSGAVAAFEQARDCGPAGLPRRPAAARAARRRRRYAGNERNLCAAAVRPICRALRHGAHRTPRLSRTGTAARSGRTKRCRRAQRPLHFGSMLDLGCGTGLGGAAFRAVADRLVGVDLSPAMIAQAAAKDLYDRLVTSGPHIVSCR